MTFLFIFLDDANVSLVLSALFDYNTQTILSTHVDNRVRVSSNFFSVHLETLAHPPLFSNVIILVVCLSHCFHYDFSSFHM